MAETRASEPYIENLVVTQRQITVQVPTDYVYKDTGRPIFQPMDRPPGIWVLIASYLTPEIKGPSKPHYFPLRALQEQGIAELEAKEKRTEQEEQGLANLKAYVADPEVIWVEDLLESEGLGSFSDLWADVHSDVLDVFPAWKEEAAKTSGMPLKILPMEWECRVPFETAKVVNVNIGVYSTKKVDGVVVPDEGTRPAQYTLAFEDNATRAGREKREADFTTNIAELTGQIAGLEAEIAALPDGAAKTAKIAQKQSVEADKANKVRDLATLKAVTTGLISQLTALPTIQASLPKLSLAILMKLSEKEGWELDKATTLANLGKTLTKLSQA
jgi:hypothetical protein